jgi:glycosyltransferase involved in cell wall biosynthesis
MKFAIVTPTIGSPHLTKCLESIQNQTYEDLVHYVFLDGDRFFGQAVDQITTTCGKRTIKTISIEENVGKGWYGHRVYAACSFLVNADVIVYLDEDNWFDPSHIETFAKLFKSIPNLQWAYSLRKVYDKDGKYICNDDCESLGKWPVFFDDKVHHIDTSCYAIRKEVAVQIGHAWYGQWGADRQFFNAVKQHFPTYYCSGKHTCNYRLDGNPNSVKSEFFLEGNKIQIEKYNNKFPWVV